MSEITRAAFSALRWNYIGFIARSGSNFLIGILLARLLGPKPFGQLAVAALVVGIANLLADAGFTSALIQIPELSDLQVRFVFTVQFLVAILMTLGCAALAEPVASAFHDPAIRGVLLAISPAFLLQAFGQTANALLRRELAFRTLQIIQVASYLIGYLLVGIPLAFAGAGVWSLVAAQLTQTGVNAVLLYLRVRHAVRPSLDLSGTVLLKFGAKVTITNLVNYGISNADNFVVGHTFGSASLGYYNRAFSLANAPADGVINSLQGVLFAGSSRAGGRLSSLRRAYLACLSAVAFVLLPPFWAMAAASTTVVVGLYGEQWRPSAALFQPLILGISMHALMAMAGPILSSLNLVEREIRAQTWALLLSLAVFWIAARYSILALAWGVCGAYFFRFVLMTYPALQILQLRWRDVVRVLTGPVLVACLATGAIRVADLTLQHHNVPPVAGMLALLSLGVLTVCLAVLFAGRFLFPIEFSELLREGMMGAPRSLMRLLFGPMPITEAPSEGYG